MVIGRTSEIARALQEDGESRRPGLSCRPCDVEGKALPVGSEEELPKPPVRRVEKAGLVVAVLLELDPAPVVAAASRSGASLYPNAFTVLQLVDRLVPVGIGVGPFAHEKESSVLDVNRHVLSQVAQTERAVARPAASDELDESDRVEALLPSYQLHQDARFSTAPPRSRCGCSIAGENEPNDESSRQNELSRRRVPLKRREL